MGKVLILLLLLFLLLFSSLFLLYKRGTYGGQKKACIYQNGVLLREIDFSSVKEPYSFRLVSSDGGYRKCRGDCRNGCRLPRQALRPFQQKQYRQAPHYLSAP